MPIFPFAANAPAEKSAASSLRKVAAKSNRNKRTVINLLARRPDERQFFAMHEQQKRAGDENRDCQTEQQTTVIFDNNAKFGQVRKNRAGNRAEREQSAEPSRRGNQQKHRRREFDNSRTDAPVGFKFRAHQRRKNVFRLFGTGKFKVQSLQQNNRHRDSAYPTDYR